MATRPNKPVETQPETRLEVTGATHIAQPIEATPTTLKAIEKLVNATVKTASELPANAPNASQIKMLAEGLKASLTALQQDTTVFRRLFFAKKTKKVIRDLNSKVSDLDEDIKISTDELVRLNEECKRKAGEIMDTAAKAHARSSSYTEFHKGLLKTVKDSLRDPNFEDPGPEPGRILSQKALDRIEEVSNRETQKYNIESAARAEAERRKNEPQSLPPPPRKYSKAKLETE